MNSTTSRRRSRVDLFDLAPRRNPIGGAVQWTDHSSHDPGAVLYASKENEATLEVSPVIQKRTVTVSK